VRNTFSVSGGERGDKSEKCDTMIKEAQGTQSHTVRVAPRMQSGSRKGGRKMRNTKGDGGSTG